MKTLIIEHDYIQAQILQEIMLSFGSCEIVENCDDAIQIIEQSHNMTNPIDLIILESAFPNLTGIDAVGRIRLLENSMSIFALDQCKIFIFTENDEFQHLIKAFESQIDGFLQKPIDKDKLIDLLLEFEML